jgi:hypothetical protein
MGEAGLIISSLTGGDAVTLRLGSRRYPALTGFGEDAVTPPVDHRQATGANPDMVVIKVAVHGSQKLACAEDGVATALTFTVPWPVPTPDTPRDVATRFGELPSTNVPDRQADGSAQIHFVLRVSLPDRGSRFRIVVDDDEPAVTRSDRHPQRQTFGKRRHHGVTRLDLGTQRGQSLADRPSAFHETPARQ